MEIVNSQKERYIKKNKFTDYQIKKLFNRIKHLIPHFNNEYPVDNNEWDKLIKNYIIPACKYISQNTEKELKECKQKAKKNPKDYKSIKRHNYILQQKKNKWNNLPYDEMKQSTS